MWTAMKELLWSQQFTFLPDNNGYELRATTFDTVVWSL
jgi:hypothetical protein